MNEHHSALALFRNACGLGVPLALECKNSYRSAVASVTHVFERPFALIGRDPKSDLVLDDEQISRRHAFLQALGGKILVVDLQSRTKLFWEGEETPRAKGSLDRNRFIQVGGYCIRRVDMSPSPDQQRELVVSSSTLDQQASEANSVSRAALELPIRMGAAPALWPLGEQLVLVGRAAECELVLNDESVSRFHAALVPTPSGVWVVDLLAREGVHVNGERVRWAWLGEGDSFRIGTFTFIVRYETPPEHLTRLDVPLNAGASVVESPRSELAVRVSGPDDGRRSLTVRRGGRSPARLETTGFAQTVEPAAFATSGIGAWDQSLPLHPSPMAMWQQQMQLMESFHNDMMMMVQMFVAMHRENLASVRHELDMVQQLTGELSALKAKLAEPSGSADASPTAEIARRPKDRGALESSDRIKRQKKLVARERTDAGDASEPTSTAPAAGHVSLNTKGRSADNVAPAESHGGGDSAQIHTVLTRRIAELQRERQGYWQRVLSALHS